MSGGEYHAVSLSSLQSEPERLQAESARLESTISKLALQNYRVFIANNDCVRALRSESKNFVRLASEIKSDLCDFVEHAAQFKEDAESCIARHKKIRTTLQNHLSILDVLELPMILDACVRNGLYDGANIYFYI